MNKNIGFTPWKKALLFWVVFLSTYFLFKVFPVPPFNFFCGVTESNFQHFKEGFYAYLITCMIEALVFRRKITGWDGFLYSRMAATIFLPWLIFLLWYIAPAVYGKFPSDLYEIIYANLITVLVGFSAVTLEQGLAQIVFFRQLKWLLWILFLISIFLYTAFTFNLPWADVFVEPAWR